MGSSLLYLMGRLRTAFALLMTPHLIVRSPNDFLGYLIPISGTS